MTTLSGFPCHNGRSLSWNVLQIETSFAFFLKRGNLEAMNDFFCQNRDIFFNKSRLCFFQEISSYSHSLSLSREDCED